MTEEGSIQIIETRESGLARILQALKESGLQIFAHLPEVQDGSEWHYIYIPKRGFLVTPDRQADICDWDARKAVFRVRDAKIFLKIQEVAETLKKQGFTVTIEKNF